MARCWRSRFCTMAAIDGTRRQRSTSWARHWRASGGTRRPGAMAIRHRASARRLNGADVDSPLAQLLDVLPGRYALVRRVNSVRLDLATRLHLAGDAQRVSGGTHHRADSVFRVVPVDQLPAELPGNAVLAAAHLDAQRDKIR